MNPPYIRNGSCLRVLFFYFFIIFYLFIAYCVLLTAYCPFFAYYPYSIGGSLGLLHE